MNPEIGICQNCPIQQICHESLKPERFNSKIGKPGEITPPYYKYYIICRHYTCNEEGRKAAQKAIETNSFETFKLFDDTVVEAIPFGSKDKQTQKGNHRLVDALGNVYSLQEEKYYPTGQNVFKPLEGFFATLPQVPRAGLEPA